MIMYVKNPKESIEKLPEIINKFSKTAGDNSHIQKSTVFLYTSDKQLEKKL